MDSIPSFTINGLDGRAFDPFRRPEWRWLAALAHIEAHTRPRPWEDPAITEAFEFQRGCLQADTAAMRTTVSQRWPLLAGAEGIYTDGGIKRDEIEARLLAGEPAAAIAAKSGIDAVVIDTYGQLFFNVADALQAGDWLLQEAVNVRSWQRPVPTEGQGWKWLAIAAGSNVLDLVIADHLGRVEPKYPDRHLLAEKARFLVKDFAAGTSIEATKSLAAEASQLFAGAIGADVSSPRGRVSCSQIAFLRMVSGLPPLKSAAKRSKKRGLPAKSSQIINDATLTRKERHGSHKEHAEVTTFTDSQCPDGIPWT